MDSSRRQVKKGMPESDMVQNIPERLGEGQDQMAGSCRCRNGPVETATSCCPMCQVAQEE